MNAVIEPQQINIPKTALRDLQDAEVLQRWGHYEEAEFAYRTILEGHPRLALMYHNIAVIKEKTNHQEEIDALYHQALAIAPGDAYLNHFYGLYLLKCGNLKEGWRRYAYRTKRAANQIPYMTNKLFCPYWDGEDLTDKSLAVWTEQGIGDEVLIATMFPEVRKLCKHLTIFCTPRMVELFARSFPDCTVVNREVYVNTIGINFNLPTFDYQASLVELAKHLRPTMLSFDKSEPYLKIDPAMVWRPNTNSNLKVGISWRSTNFSVGEQKSIPLHQWKPILTQPNIDFVSLQHGDYDRELNDVANQYGVTVYEPKATRDVDDLANVVSGLDLVISVSNTNVHIAGALGVPVWTMIPRSNANLWYWFRENEDSPWYKSATLFRYNHGEETQLIDRISTNLAWFQEQKGQV